MNLILYGALALISQTLLLWELSMLFQRHELVLGVLMFSWLVGGALGSACFRHFPKAWKKERWLGHGLMLGASLAVFLGVMAIRACFGLLRYQARPSLALICLLSFVLLVPVAALLGMALPGLANSQPTDKTLSRAYALEGLGAFLGGLASFWCWPGGWIRW